MVTSFGVRFAYLLATLTLASVVPLNSSLADPLVLNEGVSPRVSEARYEFTCPNGKVTLATSHAEGRSSLEVVSGASRSELRSINAQIAEFAPRIRRIDTVAVRCFGRDFGLVVGGASKSADGEYGPDFVFSGRIAAGALEGASFQLEQAQ